MLFYVKSGVIFEKKHFIFLELLFYLSFLHLFNTLAYSLDTIKTKLSNFLPKLLMDGKVIINVYIICISLYKITANNKYINDHDSKIHHVVNKCIGFDYFAFIAIYIMLNVIIFPTVGFSTSYYVAILANIRIILIIIVVYIALSKELL